MVANQSDSVLLAIEAPDILQTLTQVLETEGYSLIYTEPQFLDQVSIAFSDQVAQVRRWHQQVPNLPIIALVPPDVVQIDAFSEAGAMGVVPIPVSARLVLQYVETARFALETIQQARNSSQTERQLAQALHDVVLELNRNQTTDGIMQAILRTVSRVVPNDGASIMIRDGDEWLFVQYYNALEPEQNYIKPGFRAALTDFKAAYHIFSTQTGYLTPDTLHDAFWSMPVDTQWIRSYIGVPIIIEGEVFGIINLDHQRAHGFKEADLQRLQMFADQAALAILNTRHYEQSQAYARQLESRVQYRTQELENVNSALRQEIDERLNTESRLRWVLQTARCLLFSAHIESRQGALDWQFDFANSVAAQSILPLKLAPGQSYAEAWRASILPEDWERFAYVFRTHSQFNHRDYSLELRCMGSDGIIRWLLTNIQFEVDEESQPEQWRWTMVGVCTDISPLKQAETTLQRAKDELEVSVAERTVELMRANQALLDEISERRKAESAERQQRVIAEALRSASETLISALDLDSLLDYLLQMTALLLDYDAANIMLLSEDKKTARVVRQQGYETDLTQTIHDMRRYVEKQIMLQEKRPYIISDIRQYADWVDPDQVTWVRSELSVPIRIEDDVIGFLNLNSRSPNAFTTEHGEWVQAFANQAGIAIRNARFVERIRQNNAILNESVAARTAELDNERAQLRAILDSIRDGVVYYDLDGEPQYLNRALINLTGYNEQEWLYNHLEQSIYAESRERADILRLKMQRSLEEHGYWEGDVVLRRKDGTMFDARMTRTEVVSMKGEELGFVTIIRDISQAKQLEEQQSRFITSSSHELRTPIANLKTRLFLMRARPLEDFHLKHLDVMEQVINLMQHLVEDMFDYSRFQRGILEIKPEPLVLQELMIQVARYHSPEVEIKQIDLVCETPQTPITVNIDPFRFSQVLNNLIANAIQYTNTGGSILLQMELMESPSPSAVIRIQDSGRGISEEHLPHLFKPFYRATDDTRGAGLGLSIAQEIVMRHGGKIAVESQVNIGTCFTITLPLAAISTSEQSFV